MAYTSLKYLTLTMAKVSHNVRGDRRRRIQIYVIVVDARGRHI